MTDDLRSRIMADEGLSLKKYKDEDGIDTIGIGHNMEANPLPADIQAYLDANGQITTEQALALLEIDIQTAHDTLVAHLPWVANLDDVRLDVLIEMVFQMGIHAVLGFHETLEAIQSGNYGAASIRMLNSEWAKETPARCERLANLMKIGDNANA